VIGKLLNREAQARNVVAKIRADIARVEILTKHARKVRTYFEIDPTPYTVGPNSFMGVLLTKAGAQNVIPADLGDFPQISPELVVKQNPALILGVDRAAVLKRPGWNTIAAVKSGRVLNVPTELNTMLGRPGPRLGEALRGLAKLVHPELFR
jgi:iron complex transport system substrate-binding protein